MPLFPVPQGTANGAQANGIVLNNVAGGTGGAVASHGEWNRVKGNFIHVGNVHPIVTVAGDQVATDDRVTGIDQQDTVLLVGQGTGAVYIGANVVADDPVSVRLAADPEAPKQ
jgi:hypothetical protein